VLGLSLNTIYNTIRVKASGLVRKGLEMFLPFSKNGEDISGEGNHATLYTGKALSFNGTTDVLDFSTITLGDFTIAFWIKPLTFNAADEGIMSSRSSYALGYRGDTTEWKIKIDGIWYIKTTTAPLTINSWSRVVITRVGANINVVVNDTLSDTFTASTDDFKVEAIAKYATNYLNAEFSDFQIYDTAWAQADVTFDYNNPQHLVTDNSASSIALSNLKGYWHLSEGEGTTAYDSSGEGNDGTITGAIYNDQQATIPQLGLMDWAGSTVGSDYITLISTPADPSKDILDNDVRLREHSLNLDGSGYAEVPDADSLDFGTGEFSMESWVKVDYLLQAVGGSSLNTILTLGGSIASAGNAGLCVFNNFSVGAYINQQVVQSDDILTQGTWCHIIVTRDSVGLCTLYINGEAQIDTETTTADITNTLTKTIGVDTNNTRHYQNLIDDVRIYDRALSSEEISQNYNYGITKHKNESAYSDDYSSDYGF